MDNDVSRKRYTIFDWEQDLAPQVRQVELLGEINLSEEETQYLGQQLGEFIKLRQSWGVLEVREAIRKKCPCAFIVFLVSKGLYDSNAENGFWESEGTCPANLTIVNFHRLADELVQRAGFTTGPYNTAYFEKILPERLVEAVDKLGTQFDAIVVDEGQDFNDNWWLPLQCLLHDPDQGILYVFFDDNQNIYQGTKEIPLAAAPFPLTHNCRNTQSIHQQVSQFYRSDVMPTAMGPQGRPVEQHSYTNPAVLKRLLRQTLHRLIIDENVPAWDIVVLTPKSREHSQVWGFGALGNFRLVDTPTDASGEVYCTTIHKFKGLESPVVILAEIDNHQIWNLPALLYVGCSRARNHLTLLTAADLSAKIAAQLNKL